jgi:proline dehydrogenase
MELRTLEGFETHLTEDLKWRLSELDTWERMIRTCRPHERVGALRAGVALLYAHWEGYIKEAARAYLEFVSRKRLKIADLRAELAAVALRGMLGKGEQSKRSTDHTAIIAMLRDEASCDANISYSQSTIKTKSNLTFDVFEDIMHSIGCDASRHEISRTLIDARLLKNRNEIAHGRELLIEFDDWLVMRKRVVAVLKDVRTQLQNAAALEQFRR